MINLEGRMKIASVFMLRFSGILLSFLLNIYLARNYSQDTVGDYFYFFQFLVLLAMVGRFGADTALLKYSYRFSRSDKYQSLYFFLKTTLIVMLLFLGIHYTSEMIFNFRIYNYGNFSFILLFLLVAPFSFINFVAEYLRGTERHNLANISQVVLIPLMLLFFIGVMKLDLVRGYTYTIVLCFIVSGFLFLLSKGEKQNEKGSEFLEYRSSLKLFFIISLINMTISSVDIFLLGWLEDKATIAQYGLANRLSALIAIVLIITNGIIGPIFAKLWGEKNTVEIIIKFKIITKLLLSISIACFLFALFFGEYFILMIYGNSYLSIFPIFMILLFSQCVALATGPVAYLLMMTGNAKYHKNTLIVALFVNLVLNIILIPLYGAKGAAIATAISILLKNLIGFYHANRIFKFYN